MISYEKEISCGFDKLLDLVLEYENETFILVYNDKEIKVKYITMYESDNGDFYDENDPKYEEFNAIDFLNIETNEEFEFTYKDMPSEIWCKGKRII